MRKSKVLAKLRKGEPVLSVNLSMACSPLVIEMAGRIGLDAIWIDTEHRPFSQREIASMLLAGRYADVDCYVRIRKGEGYTSFFRPLEDGAAGIMVPHVKTREEAEWVVYNSKFMPIGRRGAENMMVDADLGMVDTLEYFAHANRETFVAIQIEDVEALNHLDEIVSVEGVDILFVGPADLSSSMGIALQFDHPDFQAAVSAIGAAAAAHGKWWGLPVSDIEAVAKYAARGASFFNMGGDYGMLRNGLSKVRQDFDTWIGGTSSKARGTVIE